MRSRKEWDHCTLWIKLTRAVSLIRSWGWKPQIPWMGQIKAHLAEWNFVSVQPVYTAQIALLWNQSRPICHSDVHSENKRDKRLHDFPNNFCSGHVKVSAYLFSRACTSSARLHWALRGVVIIMGASLLLCAIISVNKHYTSERFAWPVWLTQSVNGEMRWRPNPSEWEKERREPNLNKPVSLTRTLLMAPF